MVKKTVIAFIVLMLIFLGLTTHKAKAVFDCLTLKVSSNQSDKDYCRTELVQIEAELQNLLNKQKEQQKQSGTLKGDVDYLTSQINALKTKIKARALVIAQLKVNIAEKVNIIQSLSEKIDREHESLAQLLRNTNEFDDQTLVNLILSDNSISDFYSDFESYASIKQAVKASTDVIRGIKSDTEIVKKDLEKKQDAETDAKAELESAQKKVAQSEADKKALLLISKETEKVYQKLATDKTIRANKIRAALFQLRDTRAISFGTALQYAREAEAKTGISPAFLLAIITQESNLGIDTGSCYLTDQNTGTGISSKSGRIFSNLMRSRDVPVFLNVVSSLGLDPYKTLVSCPAGNSGYGGAMGPAQFIASTWMGIKAKLVAALGISNPDPWEPRHAFIASAIFLKELGADKKSYSSEIKAACKYYGTGGATCSYGRSVMSKLSKIQSNIDALD